MDSSLIRFLVLECIGYIHFFLGVKLPPRVKTEPGCHMKEMVVSDVLRYRFDCSDCLFCLHQNECIRYTQLHPDLRPFEAGGELTLQNYCTKLDTGLFMVASHTKKRPNNLVFGRMFNSQLLDMIELGVDTFKPMKDFRHPGGVAGAKVLMML